MNNKTRFYFTVAFGILFGIFVTGCSKKPMSIPENTISPDTMVSILTEIHLAQAAVSMNVPGYTARFTTSDYLPSIFKKHHTTKQRFDKSLRFYSDNPNLLDSIYKEVLDDLNRKEGEIDAQLRSGKK